MTALVLFVVFGLVGGLLVNSVMQSRTSINGVWSAALGVIGSFTVGMLFFMYGRDLVGDGPDFIVSLLAAAGGGIIFPLIVSIIKK